jgi:hypothetical protein
MRLHVAFFGIWDRSLDDWHTSCGTSRIRSTGLALNEGLGRYAKNQAMPYSSKVRHSAVVPGALDYVAKGIVE